MLPEGFAWGLALGGILASATGVTARIRRSSRPLPLAGLAAAAAAVVGIEIVEGLPREVVAGVALAAVGGTLAVRLPIAATPAVAFPGAWLATSGLELRDHEWIRPLTLIAAVLLAPLIADFDREWSRTGLGPVLLALSVAGIYGTIPDTEWIVVLLGVMIPIALLGWPSPLARLGHAGAYAMATLVCVVVGQGGQGRPASVIAGLACVAVLGLEPIVRRLRSSTSRRHERFRAHAPSLVVVHVVLVVVLSRLVGTRDSAPGATAAAAIACAAAGAVVIGLSDRQNRRHP